MVYNNSAITFAVNSYNSLPTNLQNFLGKTTRFAAGAHFLGNSLTTSFIIGAISSVTKQILDQSAKPSDKRNSGIIEQIYSKAESALLAFGVGVTVAKLAGFAVEISLTPVLSQAMMLIPLLSMLSSFLLPLLSLGGLKFSGLLNLLTGGGSSIASNFTDAATSASLKMPESFEGFKEIWNGCAPPPTTNTQNPLEFDDGAFASSGGPNQKFETYQQSMIESESNGDSNMFKTNFEELDTLGETSLPPPNNDPTVQGRIEELLEERDLQTIETPIENLQRNDEWTNLDELANEFCQENGITEEGNSSLQPNISLEKNPSVLTEQWTSEFTQKNSSTSFDPNQMAQEFETFMPDTSPFNPTQWMHEFKTFTTQTPSVLGTEYAKPLVKEFCEFTLEQAWQQACKQTCKQGPEVLFSLAEFAAFQV